MTPMTAHDLRELERKLLECYGSTMSPVEVADFATCALSRALVEIKRLNREIQANALSEVRAA